MHLEVASASVLKKGKRSHLTRKGPDTWTRNVFSLFFFLTQAPDGGGMVVVVVLARPMVWITRRDGAPHSLRAHRRGATKWKTRKNHYCYTITAVTSPLSTFFDAASSSLFRVSDFSHIFWYTHTRRKTYWPTLAQAVAGGYVRRRVVRGTLILGNVKHLYVWRSKNFARVDPKCTLNRRTSNDSIICIQTRQLDFTPFWLLIETLKSQWLSRLSTVPSQDVFLCRCVNTTWR